MAEYVTVAKKSDISLGTMKKVEIGEKEILIVNLDGEFYAIDDRCGHMNMSLAAGKLKGKHVTCPFHGATFDIATGKAVARHSEEIDAYCRSLNLPVVRTKDVKSYEVNVEGDAIKVKID